jgi:hypothetical protein
MCSATDTIRAIRQSGTSEKLCVDRTGAVTTQLLLLFETFFGRGDGHPSVGCPQ